MIGGSAHAHSPGGGATRRAGGAVARTGAARRGDGRSAIHVPTLVIQRLDDSMTPPCHGRYLASHIPGARYFEQPGDHSLRFASSGDTDRLLNEIEDFLSAASHPTQADRVLSTILSIDSSAGAKAHVLAHRGRLLRSGHDPPRAHTSSAPGQAVRRADAIRTALRRSRHPGRARACTRARWSRAATATDGASLDIATAQPRRCATAPRAPLVLRPTVPDLVARTGDFSFADRAHARPRRGYPTAGRLSRTTPPQTTSPPTIELSSLTRGGHLQ